MEPPGRRDCFQPKSLPGCDAYSGAGLSATVNLLPGNRYSFGADCSGPAASTTFTLNGYQQGSATYTGTRTTTSFTGAWGGTAVYSKASKASATFTCTCDAFAWVTDEDSNHGSAKVYIDGVLQTTV